MKILNGLLTFILAVGFFPSLALGNVDTQNGSSYDEELNESDFNALREFVQTKRDIPLEEKLTKMSIAGDIRTEWRHMSESGRKGHIVGFQRQLRGGNAVDYGSYPVSRNDFDAEFNLYFEYRTERTWAVAQLQFDNSMGVFDNNKECPKQGRDSAQGQRSINANGKLSPDPEGWHGSGKCDKLCLKKAYIGYNLYKQCDARVDVELGRRRLYSLFDSDIQFLSQFDGVAFKLSDKYEWASTGYLTIAGFVINERINHFGWAAEVGFLNIQDTGIDIKYSFIDWRKNGRAQCFDEKVKGQFNSEPFYESPDEWILNPEGFKFLNSQFTVYYNLNPEYTFNKQADFYGAFLINHNLPSVKYQKKTDRVGKNGLPIPEQKIARHLNTAWYIGFEMGEVKKEGDWSIDIEYQYVNAVAVPDGDSRGIGRGNVLDESFTTVERGNTNFKGWKFELLYALTDNLTINSIIEFTKAIKPQIGGHHRYSKFELETIYAF